MRFFSTKSLATPVVYSTSVTDQPMSESFSLPLNNNKPRQLDVDHRLGFRERGALPIALLISALIGALVSPPARASTTIDIGVAEDGRYQISFEDVEHLMPPVSESRLRLLERGIDIPFNVVSADHIFGSGDRIEFIGRRPASNRGWFSEYARENVYQLRILESDWDKFGPIKERLTGPVVQHIEQDLIRVALPRSQAPEQTDRWYWQRLSASPTDVFNYEFTWDEIPETIRIGLTGLSYDSQASAAGLPQHLIKISLDGKPLGEASWDGQDSVVWEAAAPFPSTANDGAKLEIRIPERQIPGSKLLLVDSVLVNWLELEFKEDHQGGRSMPSRDGSLRIKISAENKSPSWIKEQATYRDLRRRSQQADYLMISHPDLMDALAPLAAFHRSRGLNVEIVNVKAIYDQFNQGVVSPTAIRDFIRYTQANWREPAPQMILLAGDASWAHPKLDPRDRTTVPTHHSLVGNYFAANDSFYVTSNTLAHPDIAIGRLPAGSAEEMRLLVVKLIEGFHALGGAKKRIAWIAGIDPNFQSISADIAESAGQQGFDNRFIFSKTDAHDTQRVAGTFANQNAVIHFLGHGGRFVWRTGSPDLRAAKDLFSNSDLLSLETGSIVPIVLSMTCSSGPFDHPRADSLAEQMLMAPDRGALAVLAASWQIPPSKKFSARLLNELQKPGVSIGQAVMRAKQGMRNTGIINAYNLLGDPAMPLLWGHN